MNFSDILIFFSQTLAAQNNVKKTLRKEKNTTFYHGYLDIENLIYYNSR